PDGALHAARGGPHRPARGGAVPRPAPGGGRGPGRDRPGRRRIRLQRRLRPGSRPDRSPRDHGGMTMALFSRRKRREAEQAEHTERRDEGAVEDGTDETVADEAAGPDAEAVEETADEEAPRGEHLEDGPYDEADAPEEDRIDLGGLQVPTVDGLELRMEVDQRSGSVTGANLVIAGSSLQVQAFAAPKSRGLWEDVRSSLRDSVVSQGGTAETRPGAF